MAVCTPSSTASPRRASSVSLRPEISRSKCFSASAWIAGVVRHDDLAVLRSESPNERRTRHAFRGSPEVPVNLRFGVSSKRIGESVLDWQASHLSPSKPCLLLARLLAPSDMDKPRTVRVPLNAGLS